MFYMMFPKGVFPSGNFPMVFSQMATSQMGKVPNTFYVNIKVSAMVKQ